MNSQSITSRCSHFRAAHAIAALRPSSHEGASSHVGALVGRRGSVLQKSRAVCGVQTDMHACWKEGSF